jgi:hypothetical protein
MPQYRVINTYIDRQTRGRREPGEIVTLGRAVGDRMVSRRLVVPARSEPQIETATAKREVETTATRVAAPRHVGGGVYELPDGERVRGKDAAWKRMQS